MHVDIKCFYENVRTVEIEARKGTTLYVRLRSSILIQEESKCLREKTTDGAKVYIIHVAGKRDRI